MRAARHLGWLVVSLVVLVTSVPASSQTITDPLEPLGPGVPFMLDPVIPATSLRLQNHFIPVTTSVGTAEQSAFLTALRLHGSFPFTDSVQGEASLPLMILSSDAEGQGGFEIGNPRIGMEWALIAEEGKQHRWTASLDFYLPFSQIGSAEVNRLEGEFDGQPSQQDVEDELTRRSNYFLAATTLPTLTADYLAEHLTVAPGTHYRLQQGRFISQINFQLPLFMGFDFSEDIFFHRHSLGLLYGLTLGYDARPVFPTVEFGGLTHIAEESSTALFTTAGLHASFSGFEPGVGVTYPITLDNDAIETSVYIHLDLAYKFD